MIVNSSFNAITEDVKNNLLVLEVKNNPNARCSNCGNFLKSLVPFVIEISTNTYGKLYGYGKNLKNWIIRSQVHYYKMSVMNAVQRLNGYRVLHTIRYSPPTFERSWIPAQTALPCSDIAHNGKFCTFRAKITISNEKIYENMQKIKTFQIPRNNNSTYDIIFLI